MALLVHWDPSQCIAWPLEPTAQQSLEVVQVTACSTEVNGVETKLQSVPFQ